MGAVEGWVAAAAVLATAENWVAMVALGSPRRHCTPHKLPRRKYYHCTILRNVVLEAHLLLRSLRSHALCRTSSTLPTYKPTCCTKIRTRARLEGAL